MEELKKSKFNFEAPITHKDQEFIAVCNLLTRGLCIIPEQRWSHIPESDSIDSDKEDIGIFVDNGLLVKSTLDERKMFDAWNMQSIFNTDILKFKILVTRRCNLECAYCSLVAEKKSMSPETADAFVSFCKEKAGENAPRRILIDFLGGEPLLNLRAIERISADLFHFCRGENMDFETSITTNGSLATKEKIAPLRDIGLKSIRVSHTGPGEIQNKLRPFRGGGGTYENIKRNLSEITAAIDTKLELQFDSTSDQYERIPGWLDEMASEGIVFTNVNASPILPRRVDNRFSLDKEGARKSLALKREAAKRGFPVYDSLPASRCISILKNFYVVDTNGDLIACPSVQQSEMVLGNVETGVFFPEESQYISLNLPEECMNDCKYLPVCSGGCKLMSMVRSGRFEGVDCKKEELRLYLEDHVRHHADEWFSRKDALV